MKITGVNQVKREGPIPGLLYLYFTGTWAIVGILIISRVLYIMMGTTRLQREDLMLKHTPHTRDEPANECTETWRVCTQA